ncbi:hypothetical protein QWZ13_04835 [Reinekea marina]|nr:hypothetical protein [Reinekea marina]MDN3648232.1 hypothetical protein [Reinekea marina]
MAYSLICYRIESLIEMSLRLSKGQDSLAETVGSFTEEIAWTS